LPPVITATNPTERLKRLLDFANTQKEELCSSDKPKTLFGFATSDAIYNLSAEGLFKEGITSDNRAVWVNNYEANSLEFSQISHETKESLINWVKENMLKEHLHEPFEVAVNDKLKERHTLQDFRDTLHRTLINVHAFELEVGANLPDGFDEDVKSKITDHLFDNEEIQQMIVPHALHFAKSLNSSETVCFYPNPIDNRIGIGLFIDGKLRQADKALTDEEWKLSVTRL
jgi:hypothetical protein